MNLHGDSQKRKPAKEICFLIFFTILALKLCVVDFVWPVAPVWDEWDAEAAGLYRLYENGSLDIAYLISGHNEHRIMTTRLVHLFSYWLNGFWSPLANIFISAVLHSGWVVGFFILLYRNDRGNWLFHMLFCFLVFGLPISLVNLLIGFQIQFYLNITFGSLAAWEIAVWMTADGRGKSRFPYIGFGYAILAALSLSGGVFISLAGAVGIAIYCFRIRVFRKDLVAASLLLGLCFLIGAYFTPRVLEHGGFRVKSFPQFVENFGSVFSWPFPNWLPFPSSLFFAVFIYSPAGYFFWNLLFGKRDVSKSEWPLVLVFLWVVLQMLAISYARYTNGARWGQYLDLYIIAFAINFAWFLKFFFSRKEGCVYVKCCQWVWVFLIVTAVARQGTQVASRLLIPEKQLMAARVQNIKKFVVSNDYEAFRSVSGWERGYHDAGRLGEIISDPVVKKSLPYVLRGGQDARGVLDIVAESLIHRWWVLALISIAIGVIGLWRFRNFNNDLRG
jgi:hypothetical protein